MDPALMLWITALGIPIMWEALVTSDKLTSKNPLLVSSIVVATRLPILKRQKCHYSNKATEGELTRRRHFANWKPLIDLMQ